MKRRPSVLTAARNLLGAAVLLAALFMHRTAGADPLAPDKIRQKYNLSCTPQCTLCHGTNLGGYGNYRIITVNGMQKAGFILTLRDKCGFVATDQSTWDPALSKCDSDPTIDTDGDGESDGNELRAGTDPNDPSPTALICGGGPTFGCVRIARGTSVDGYALLASSAVLLAGIALARRRRA